MKEILFYITEANGIAIGIIGVALLLIVIRVMNIKNGK